MNVNGRRGPKLGTSPFGHLVGEILAHGYGRARELDDTGVPDEGGNQGGHKGGHQRASTAIHSELIRAHQSSSELIRAHQRPSAHPSRGSRAPKKCSVRNRRPNLAEKIASRCRSIASFKVSSSRDEIASFKVSSSRDEPLASDEL